MCKWWKKQQSGTSRGSGSSQSGELSTYDKRRIQAEKNQRKYEDGLRKGYIDKAEWERIDRE